jgi:hypothetical protein
MATGNRHSWDSLLEAMLGPASRSLTSSFDPTDESVMDAYADAVPLVPDTLAAILYA